MSLVPYHAREDREIVLRHHNAIVVRDPSSQRLELRGAPLTECPTCHQPLRSLSPKRHYDGSDQHGTTYVNPNYFRMLRDGNATHGRIGRPEPERDDADLASHARPPPSPVRRLVEPSPLSASADDDDSDMQEPACVSSVRGAELVSSTRIRRNAYSPNYFNTFFIIEKELGRGGKGVVLLVRHEIDGCNLGQFACKRVPVGDHHAWLEKVLVEVELLAKLSHPNLVSYRHVWIEDYQPNRFGPPVACAFILQKFCNGGDLLHYIVGDQGSQPTNEELKAQARRRSRGGAERPHGLLPTQRRLPFEHIFSIFRDITSGLAYLHEANYIHRDLKPSNCLLHREGSYPLVCMISDFGEVQPEKVVRKSTGTTGTISFCAPEVLRKNPSGRYGNFTAKSDIFSLGMILYLMCFGRLPYQSADMEHEELEDMDMLRAEITDWKGFRDERQERPDLPARLYQLLQELLSLDAAERPTANEVLSVMKSESSLDGVAGRARTGFVHRVHNLDARTPVSGSSLAFAALFETVDGKPADAAQKARATSLPDEHLSQTTRAPDSSPQPTRPDSIQNPARPDLGWARRRNQSLALSQLRCRSRSPDQRTDGVPNPIERGFVRSSHAPPAAPSPSPGASPTLPAAPPLLMAPPPSSLLAKAHHHAQRWLVTDSASAATALRLVLFLAKLVSMSALCWPYTLQLGVGTSLATLAAVDLVMSTASPPATATRPSQRHVSFLRPGMSSSLHWDARVGWVLLLVHLTLLWAVERFGTLCALPPGGLGRWSEL